MSKEMLINVSAGEECRIALVEDGRLEELYMERTSATSHVGNIYKGKVTNVEASIQAAFVDFGLGRNGFLHISDLMPTYFGRDGGDFQETVGRKLSRRDRPPIQRCLRRGDDIVVQIIKEGIGTKGPTLSTYLSIPGKMLVMMPGMGKMGVSKKIEDDNERRRLRGILDRLRPPKDVAFIIRTAGVGKSEEEIERDLRYLTRLWERIEDLQREPGPLELYTEGDLVARTVRDVYTSDVERIVVDDADVARRVRDVISITSPEAADDVELYDDPIPLFSRFEVESEIEQMYSRHVPLPSGGSLVIDSTEAIVAIDVNSGKFRDHSDAEMTAFKTDMEAAEEIPRQLKLRDLGGVIICDFIDLRYERHRRELEEKLFENFKRDRSKTKVLRMSQFGIIELTRQRMRPSLKRSIYFDCPHCKGAGLVKTPESISLDVMRKLAVALNDAKVVRAELSVAPDVAFYLLNKKRAALTDLEDQTEKTIVIKSDATVGLDELQFALFDAREGIVVLEEIGMTVPERGHTTQLGNRPAGHTSQARGSRGGRRLPPPAAAQGGADAGYDEPEEDQDDLSDEDRLAIENGANAVDEREGQHGSSYRAGKGQPILEREEDRTDMPAILETEAGDEVADEYADEEEGYGQSADAGGDRNRSDRRDERPAARVLPPGAQRTGGPPQPQPPQARGDYQPRPPQGRDQGQPVGRGQAPGRDAGGRPGGYDPNVQQPVGDAGEGGEAGGRRRRRRRRRRGGRGGAEGADTFQQPNGNPPAYGGELAGKVAGEYGDGEDEDDNIGNRREDYDDDDRGNGVGTFNDVEPADEISAAAEGGDGTDADAINTEFSDGPPTPAGEDNGEGEGGGSRRRRRRRGGRRHRRDGEPAAEGQPGTGAASPVQELFPEEADAGGVVTLNVDIDAVDVPTTAHGAVMPDALSEPVEIDPEPENPEPIAVEPEPVAAKPRGRGKKVAKVAAPVEEPAEEEEAPAKPARGKVAKVAKTAKVAKVAKKTVAKVAKKTAKGVRPSKAADVAEPADVVSTGSTDAHLADDDGDEAAEPATAGRPKSYGDLDAIPDDFD